MKDETNPIQETFEQYVQAFQPLRPLDVLPFYHYPALLITPEKAAVISNRIIGFCGFRKAMAELKRRGFSRSYTESLQVKQLSDMLAIVTGVVIRLKTDDTELERFGLAYTLRKIGDRWKIIVGALYAINASRTSSLN